MAIFDCNFITVKNRHSFFCGVGKKYIFVWNETQKSLITNLINLP